MNLFETETWRAFFPNFIAVVASIVLTFGTDRAIQEYNHRQDIREVIAVLKADARESFEYYRETADNCRRICASTGQTCLGGNPLFDLDRKIRPLPDHPEERLRCTVHRVFLSARHIRPPAGHGKPIAPLPQGEDVA